MRLLVRFLVAALLVTLPYAAASRHPALVQAATADPFETRVFNDGDESGSPDGALVVGHKDGAAGRLHLRDLKTGAERVLVDLDGTVDHIVWSPDSQRLAFTFTPKAPPTAEVRVVTVATGASQTIAASGLVLAWTAGNEILVSTRRVLSSVAWTLIPVAGGPSSDIFTAPFELPAGGITADGASLIFDGAGSRIVLHHIESGLERTVTAIEANETFLAMSPDGRLVAFASDMDNGWAVYVAPLDRLPVRRPLRIASLDGRPDKSAAWWTRGGVLALASVTYGATAPYRVDVDAKTGRALGLPRRLTRGPDDTTPIVSPDSRQIGYWFGDRQAAGVAVLDASSGRTRRRLVRGPASRIAAFGWRAPDEVVVYDGDAEPEGFAAMNVTTGVLLPLAPASIDRRDFVYLPHTQEVLYASGRSNTQGVVLRARSLASGAERIVATIDFLTGFRASPDGRHVVYCRWLAAPGQGRLPASELRVMTIDGTPEKLLLSTPAGGTRPAAWSPDGKFLLYYAGSTPRVMNVETLESWSFLDAPGQPQWFSLEAAWAPDGSFVVLTGDGTWQEPHPLAWGGVTYEAVTRMIARAGK